MAEGVKQFVVKTEAGSFRSDHMTEQEAQSACDRANQAAEELNITTRYKVEKRAAAA